MANEVKLIRSGTWDKANIDQLSEALNDTIRDFVEENERIINIQYVEENGKSRFWIYTTTI